MSGTCKWQSAKQEYKVVKGEVAMEAKIAKKMEARVAEAEAQMRKARARMAHFKRVEAKVELLKDKKNTQGKKYAYA